MLITDKYLGLQCYIWLVADGERSVCLKWKTESCTVISWKSTTTTDSRLSHTGIYYSHAHENCDYFMEISFWVWLAYTSKYIMNFNGCINTVFNPHLICVIIGLMWNQGELCHYCADRVPGTWVSQKNRKKGFFHPKNRRKIGKYRVKKEENRSVIL